jgi:hypothetical protein
MLRKLNKNLYKNQNVYKNAELANYEIADTAFQEKF